MPYIHFTQEQIEQAQNADLEEFLRSRGEKLKRSGSEWEWRDGSAKVTIRQNQWYHHYEQTGGKAIDFVRRFYNLDFPDAVQMLLGSGYIPLAPSVAVKQQKSVKPFVLPQANSDMRRVFAYLMKQRFIDRDIIHYFAHNGTLYEDAEHCSGICSESYPSVSALQTTKKSRTNILLLHTNRTKIQGKKKSSAHSGLKSVMNTRYGRGDRT